MDDARVGIDHRVDVVDEAQQPAGLVMIEPPNSVHRVDEAPVVVRRAPSDAVPMIEAMLMSFDDANKQLIAAQTPLGRLGTPAEIASAALFLAGPGGRS